MSSSFGARLRAQRERQLVTLDAIAEQTKIRQRLLDDLERDDVSHWPSGIFRRSYLRTYAQAIGLDPEATVREFLELYPDPEVDVPAAIAAAVPAPPTRLRYLIASAMDTLPQFFQSGQKDAAPVAAVPSLRVSHPLVTADAEANDDGASIEADVPPAVVTPIERTARATEESASPGVDLLGVAQLCQELACAQVPGDVTRLLGDAARILRAAGVILWMWDAKNGVLWPSVSHGYARELLAQLPSVRPDTDNAIAAAFRAVATRVVNGNESTSGAVAVPLITPTGCAGVLAFEFRNRRERHDDVHAMAIILAAQLSIFAEAPPVARAATA